MPSSTTGYPNRNLNGAFRFSHASLLYLRVATKPFSTLAAALAALHSTSPDCFPAVA